MKSNKKIKILFTLPNFKTAGSQYVLLSLFRGIDREAFEPFVCVEHHSDLIPEEIPIENRLIFQWTGNKRRDILGFKNILKKHKIDLLHSWDYKSNYLEPLATRLAGIKYLYTKKNNAWSKRWFLKSWISHHIAYDNPEMASRFFNGLLFRNKISFVPHGVDTELFRPLEKTPHQNFIIGNVGNLGENKNQLFLIKVLKTLPENVILHLYGNAEKAYRSRLEVYIKANGLGNRVYFGGLVANRELPKILGKIDLFVLASHQEGLPVSILEAMACGVPVLSSDSGGGSRYLLDSEFVFSLDSPDEFMAKFLNIYNWTGEERREVAQRLRQKVLETHTLEKEIAKYEKLYRQLV